LDWEAGEVTPLRFLRAFLAAACLQAVVFGVLPARAVEPVNVRTDAAAIDLTAAVDRQRTDSDRILVSTAPGTDGIVQRMDVRAREGNTSWAVFALANSGNEQIDRLIVIPHYRLVGSGLLWPDLGLSRVVTVTSSGERPERQENAHADIFRITLDPGAVMTYVAELRTNNLTQIYLWEPDAYKDKVNSITLYYGIVIGISGLLALFLTIGASRCMSIVGIRPGRYVLGGVGPGGFLGVGAVGAQLSFGDEFFGDLRILSIRFRERLFERWFERHFLLLE